MNPPKIVPPGPIVHVEEVTMPGAADESVQPVPAAYVPQAAPVMVTYCPGDPETGLRTIVPGTAKTGLGTVIEEIETNSAEVSSSTTNRELELRGANSKHTTINS
jgi:hypothetical protein